MHNGAAYLRGCFLTISLRILMSGFAFSLEASSDDGCFLELQHVVINAITAKPWLVAKLFQTTWHCNAPHVHAPCNCYGVNDHIATATLRTTFGACALKPASFIECLIVAFELPAIASTLSSLRHYQYRLCDLSRHGFESKLILVFVVFVACLVRVFVAYLTHP